MFMLDGRPLPMDIPFEHNGIRYPANWLRLTSWEDKQAIGIVEVPDPEYYDDRFYWAPGVPKDLDQLKQTWTKMIDQTAYGLLLSSDWMVVRKQEVGTGIPQAWSDFRQAVRAYASSRRQQLLAATDIDGFITVACVVQWPMPPDAQNSLE